MRSIYVAGPMRGYRRYNFDAFADASSRLRAGGFHVLSPAEHDLAAGFDVDKPLDDQPITLTESILWDLTTIAACDAIALLPGWEDSQGCALELRFARFVGKEIYEYHPIGSGLIYKLTALPVEVAA